jgi:signal transduction histidine kinase
MVAIKKKVEYMVCKAILGVTVNKCTIESIRAQIQALNTLKETNPPLAVKGLEAIHKDGMDLLSGDEQIDFMLLYSNCLFTVGQFTEAIEELTYVISLCKKSKLKTHRLGLAYQRLGVCLIYLSRIQEAHSFLRKAERQLIKYGTPIHVFELLMNMAHCYSAQFQYDKALENLFTAESIAMKEGTAREKHLVTLGLGNVYTGCNDLPKATKYYILSAKHADELENEGYSATVKSNLSRIYSMNGEHEKALPLALEVIDIYKRYNRVHLMASMLMNIGIILNGLDRPAEALEYFERSAKHLPEAENPHLHISTLMNIADSYMKLDDNNKALKIFKIAVAKAESYDMQDLLVPINQLICRIYGDRKQWKKVLDHYTASVKAETAIWSNEKETQIQNIEHEFNLRRQKQESEIYRLKNVELKKKNKLINEQKTQLEAALEELKQVHDNKTKLFSIVAHDLRSPLSSLYQGIELAINSEIPDDEIDDFMAELHKSAFQVYSLTDNLLRWAGKQLTSIVNNPQNALIVPLCENIVTQHQLLIKAKHIQLRQHYDALLPAYVDPGLWSVVFRNLLSNAIKFTPNHGTISIEIEPVDGFYQCTISDSGSGIVDVQNIFGSKNLGTSNDSKRESGIGLGLVLVKEFVEMLGGNVTVSSLVGKGSSFCFTFPIGNSATGISD